MKAGRVIGVDYGKKRVGLAMADPLLMFARPLGVFDPRTAVDALRKVEGEFGIDTIVVGWPFLPDGSEGEATARVQEYVNRLQNAFPGATVLTWDERYTSEIAGSALKERRRISGTKRREPSLDAMAACVILQDFLER